MTERSENDNRSYVYQGGSDPNRPDYDAIVDWIPNGSRVIDLGCGDGGLLHLIQKVRSIAGTGIELSESGVRLCRERGLNVHQGRIDEPLPFANNSFDYAICHVTIQMVMYPEVLVREMKRIARFQIISFPNFAFYKNRLELLVRGRMPRKMLFGYQWYSTGHIHQLSQADFLALIRETGGLEVEQYNAGMSSTSIKRVLMRTFPNLFQQIFIYLLKRTE
jgi:methionine biosynthesis protein MetW